jgi:transposase
MTKKKEPKVSKPLQSVDANGITKPKHAGGRPSLYKPEYCEQIVAHMSDGSSATSFAASIGTCRDTISSWASERPEFSVALKKGKAACAAWWEKVSRSNAMEGGGNAALCIFGLKNMAPHEWKEKIEVEGSQSITINITGKDAKL